MRTAAIGPKSWPLSVGPRAGRRVILEDAGDDGPLIPGTIHDAAGEIIDVPPPVRVPFLGMRGGSRREPGSHAGAMLAGPLHACRGFTTYELP